MKRAAVVMAVFVLLAVLTGTLAAQDNAFDVEGWKKRVASPTYGLAVGFLVPSDDSGDLEPIPMPGIELRIFNGINVAKRGGFFTGYEVGTIFFIAESDTIALTGGGEVYFSGLASTVFLLSKYGYRLDLGVEAAGLSVGAELGIGAQMSIGGIDIYDVNGTSEGSASTQFPFSVMLDAAAEGAFRFGQNFRIFARIGASVIPPQFDYEGSVPGESFGFEMSPGIINARLGFALNY
jgi:hypothetical protein